MEKITETLLLEKGSPPTYQLEEIKNLDLSKRGLKLQDLPVELLSRLCSLERWNLSGNRLHALPKNLMLPELRYLDLSENQMEDVTTLESLCNLEELKMEDNLYITVSDNYKLMVLLPNLRIYNGKDVTTTANHLRYVFSENLRIRIRALWEKSFSLPDALTAEDMSQLETNFVHTARQQVKYGPSSVSDFTRWKVEMLAKEHLRSVKDREDEEVEMIKSTKRERTASVTNADIKLMPRKKPRPPPPTHTVADSPHKSKLRLKPHTHVRMSPRGRDVPTSLPSRGPVQGLCKESGAQGLHEQEAQPVCLKLVHVLQCHSRQDSVDDVSTQLWACAFQPNNTTGGAAGSRLVATCGGDSVCVIDCETGLVMKKYKVPGEEFFSLAWSTVLMSRGGGASAQHCSILAAGGKRGLVKLIHPRNNMAYGEFRASRKSLSVLRFSHQQGNFLFTGSYDNKIVMWDVGGVDSQYNFNVVQLLLLENTSTPLHICLPPSCPSTHLLVACEDGLRCYDTQPAANKSTKRWKEVEITFPVYQQEDGERDYHTVDGLSFLTDDIVASKNFMHGSIYLWSWSRTMAQRPGKNRSVCAVVVAELQWACTDVPYLALNTCPSQSFLACGDDSGRLWTYSIQNIPKSGFHSGKPVVTTEVLEWPAPVRRGHGQVEGPSINSVAMDPNLNYLVALSDKNLVMVWKRVQS